MWSRGVEGADAAYLTDPRKLIEQVRRFGAAGPADVIVERSDAMRPGLHGDREGAAMRVSFGADAPGGRSSR
jgi:hypothetical protein